MTYNADCLKKYIQAGIQKTNAIITGPFRVMRDSHEYSKSLRKNCSDGINYNDFKVLIRNNRYIYSDIVMNAGDVDSHYFLQDIYMAREVIRNRPQYHYDIGSRIDGFISHLLCCNEISKVIMIDIRPFQVGVSKLDFIQADATKLDGIPDESIESLSSLHAVEHFGLGRYGDPVDAYAWEKALRSMQKKIKEGGMLYLSVPVGSEAKVCFNAHRIFTPSIVTDTLDKMKLNKFAFIHDYKVTEVSEDDYYNKTYKLGDYDCGMFVFQKK